jgi:hypothetical protein
MPGRAAEMIRRKGAFLRSSRWSDLTLSAPGLTWSPQCQAGAQKAHRYFIWHVGVVTRIYYIRFCRHNF